MTAQAAAIGGAHNSALHHVGLPCNTLASCGELTRVSYYQTDGLHWWPQGGNLSACDDCIISQLSLAVKVHGI